MPLRARHCLLHSCQQSRKCSSVDNFPFLVVNVAVVKPGCWYVRIACAHLVVWREWRRRRRVLVSFRRCWTQTPRFIELVGQERRRTFNVITE